MRILFFFILLLLAGMPCSNPVCNTNSEAGEHSESQDLLGARDWFTLRRTWPQTVPDIPAYLQAMELARHHALAKTAPDGFGANWQLEGPDNIGGRINAIAIDPVDTSVIYVGNAGGGVFKTTDGGKNWQPIFDDQAFLAIGSLAIDPKDHNTIYIGTGDPQNTIASYLGNGIYRSKDAGKTWQHLGLDKESIVAKIIVHPDSSNVIYAACTGTPFIRDNNRGLYKSTDGGKTWNNVLFLNQDAGIIDIVMDPVEHSTIYATGWKTTYIDINAFSSPVNQIYKSTNGGQSWTTLRNGLPAFNMGRIGLAVSPTNHNKLYAFVCDSSRYTELMGIFKTTDGGNNWSSLPTTGLDTPVLGHFGWYFGKISIDPATDDNVFLCSVDLWKYDNSSQSWGMAAPPWFTYEVHADKHDMQWLDKDHFIVGTDGGAFKYDRTSALWSFLSPIPNTQFYHVAINPFDNLNYYGGAQDNGTSMGNASSPNNWTRMAGGDGFQPWFSSVDQNVFFAEYQNGEIQDMSSGSIFFNPATYGDRVAWDMPYIGSMHEPNIYYAGTFRLFKNAGGSVADWGAISNDLSTGMPPTYPAGRNIITTIAEAPLSKDYLFVGTSDANVWKTEDGGKNWIKINTGLPVRYVTSIKGSPTDAKTIYVAHSGYKMNEYIPHLHKSTDLGNSWQDISGDMPPVGINDVLVIPYAHDSIIFLATDAGVYGTINGGKNWNRLGNGMPIMPVNDIEFERATSRIVAGTFARSIMTYPMDSVLSKYYAGINSRDRNSIGLSIYPNPVNDKLNINIEAQNHSNNYFIKIFDLNGKTVIQAKVQAGTHSIALPAGMKAGAYFIQVSWAEGVLVTRKFLKLE
jgi:photosystem II stability/assembly factor-like uncharacterized protein